MRYSRFETLVLAVGVVVIIGSLFFSIDSSPVFEEVVAQLMLLGVLLGAVHWGRKGGFVAATLASMIYIMMRIPMVVEHGGLTMDVTSLILVRVLTYGLIGIVGGELCGRIKYIFAKMEDSSSIDEWSKVYNQRFIARALEAAIAQFERYATDFSIILIEISEQILVDLRPSRQRALIRGIASYIRNDIRLVDELGRLEDGRFIAVLPHTDRKGAEVVAARLHNGICDTVGAKAESIATSVLATPEDISGLGELRDRLSTSLDASDQPVESAS